MPPTKVPSGAATGSRCARSARSIVHRPRRSATTSRCAFGEVGQAVRVAEASRARRALAIGRSGRAARLRRVANPRRPRSRRAAAQRRCTGTRRRAAGKRVTRTRLQRDAQELRVRVRARPVRVEHAHTRLRCGSLRTPSMRRAGSVSRHSTVVAPERSTRYRLPFAIEPTIQSAPSASMPSASRSAGSRRMRRAILSGRLAVARHRCAQRCRFGVRWQAREGVAFPERVVVAVRREPAQLCRAPAQCVPTARALRRAGNAAADSSAPTRSVARSVAGSAAHRDALRASTAWS